MAVHPVWSCTPNLGILYLSINRRVVDRLSLLRKLWQPLWGNVHPLFLRGLGCFLDDEIDKGSHFGGEIFPARIDGIQLRDDRHGLGEDVFKLARLKISLD